MGKHKEWRKLAKKARRKRIRQTIARKLHDENEKDRLAREQSPRYIAWLEEQAQAEEFAAQEEARLATEREAHWLKVEEEARVQWLVLQEKLVLAREERAKQVARIKAEWEREQRKLKELKEKKEREAEEKLKQQQRLQEQIDYFVEHGGEVPEGLNTNFETNPAKPVCPFFNKTGACRFKDGCSRNHVRPGISRVLLIPNFYSHYSLQETENEHGTDSGLEFESQDTYEHFKEFFNDVIPEMETCGYIKQFKVCCNHGIHLRGNVYIEYSNLREAIRGYKKFHCRWYGGKQLHVEFCNIHSWKSAICGLFARQRCPKGTLCNFLHVFPNPKNFLTAADKDLHRTPTDEMEIDEREIDGRNWRWSESPERLPVVQSDRKSKHSRSRSREHHMTKRHARKPHRSSNRDHERRYKSSTSVK
ncbi:hypothetical protein PPYR_09017 [Photinus pyralis]|uniref:C3H1-type domain-containing protein n=2 Tax=Photinus pyralis TaxID=7054 RepID=A0A5N4AL39_PHOPY|nr:U2 small nuclear ribonucleoprotein auxiliary factor 35 kDa subunit-related protein 2 [Photinus pyralis]KAB0798024.1 hypothetical protein PPYR_09017 [Photinus pyralis]